MENIHRIKSKDTLVEIGWLVKHKNAIDSNKKKVMSLLSKFKPKVDLNGWLIMPSNGCELRTTYAEKMLDGKWHLWQIDYSTLRVLNSGF